MMIVFQQFFQQQPQKYNMFKLKAQQTELPEILQNWNENIRLTRCTLFKENQKINFNLE